MKNRTLRIARTALLAALTITLGSLETLLPPLPFFPPGAKPGIANIVVMYALLRLGAAAAVPLCLTKALTALLLRGVTAGFLSLCGGLLSVCVLMLLCMPKNRQVSYLLLGVTGALFHNLGQLLGCAVLLGGTEVFWYAPMLCLFGIAAGILTGSVLRLCAPYLNRMIP